VAKRERRTFGTSLRKSRIGRGLSLREVEALSKKLAVDSAGTISQPYLSQLESDKTTAISLPKLITLAAVYAVPADELIAAAPPEEQAALRGAMQKWRKFHRPEPAPLRYMPSITADHDAELDAAFAQTAVATQIPFGNERAARAMIRKALLMCLAPGFVRPPRRVALLREFWKVGRRWGITPIRREQAPSGWRTFVCEFVDWMVYEKCLGSQIASLVDRWMAVLDDPNNARSQLLQCTMKEAADERDYGFRMLPVAVAYGARWRELACRFYSQHRREEPPVPPRPSDAATDYIAFFVFGCPYRPEFTEDAYASTLASAVAALTPDIGGPLDPQGEPHEAVAKFLGRSDRLISNQLAIMAALAAAAEVVHDPDPRHS